jgi:hypothetical protein
MSQRNPEPKETVRIEFVSPSGTISHTQRAPEGEEGTTQIMAVGSNMAKIIEALLNRSKS